jgi:ORF6N domain
MKRGAPVEGKECKVAPGQIQQLIFLIRGQRVMLSTHLAELYEVEPRVLIQAVKRNIERFPEDFMFQLTTAEFADLKSQIVISSWGGLRRAIPYAFTEQGVAMLSSVLNSERAIEVNVAIMRAFVQLRRMIGSHEELARKLAELEARLSAHDEQIQAIFEAIRQLMAPPGRPPRKIGFGVDEPRGVYGRKKPSVGTTRSRAKKRTR